MIFNIMYYYYMYGMILAVHMTSTKLDPDVQLQLDGCVHYIAHKNLTLPELQILYRLCWQYVHAELTKIFYSDL